jgi:hypothetical protein
MSKLLEMPAYVDQLVELTKLRLGRLLLLKRDLFDLLENQEPMGSTIIKPTMAFRA